MAKTLDLVFRNEAGKTVTLHIANPKDDVTGVQAKTVMQDIIDRKIFTSQGGDLVQIVDVRSRENDTASLL